MPREIITIECTEARKEGKSPSRYTTTRNKKLKTEKLEIKKYIQLFVVTHCTAKSSSTLCLENSSRQTRQTRSRARPLTVKCAPRAQTEESISPSMPSIQEHHLPSNLSPTRDASSRANIRSPAHYQRRLKPLHQARASDAAYEVNHKQIFCPQKPDSHANAWLFHFQICVAI